MPVLAKIVVRDYRNIGLQELEFSPGINCISGGNGQGKTNLLDAVYYLSMTKSAFAPADRWLIRHGSDSFAIAGTYTLEDGLTSRVSVQSGPGSDKKLVRDDKTIQRRSEHIGQMPVVMVSPCDNSLVSEGGDERRRFANAVLSQIDPAYLAAAQVYNRLLAQRNAALKAGSPRDLVEIFDVQMSDCAATIHSARKSFATGLGPQVQEIYTGLAGSGEEVGVKYRSDLDTVPLADRLRDSFDLDSRLGYTTSGVQRDDFVFTLDGTPIRRTGSQGQQKSFLVALKFAQYAITRRSCGRTPILLLDDLFDKLDPTRTSMLLKMVSGNQYGQIFITDCNKLRLDGIALETGCECRSFKAEGGAFLQQ